MWTAWFGRLKTLFVIAIYAKRHRSACDADGVAAYVAERLRNNLLLSGNTARTASPVAANDSLHVRSQSTARHSCGAH